MKLEKAVEGVDRWHAAELEAQQGGAVVFGAIARRLTNENEVGPEGSGRLQCKE